MNFPVKLIFVFMSIFVLSVSSSVVALREINRLEVNIKNDIRVVVPLRAALFAINDRALSLRTAKLVLTPEQNFAKCWAKWQQYKAQFGDLHNLQSSLDELLSAEGMPITRELWHAQAGHLKQWQTLFQRLDTLFRQWFASGIANPDLLYVELEESERQQSALLADLHNIVLSGESMAEAARAFPTDGGPLQRELTHFRASRKLLADGIWDGLRPYTLPDGRAASVNAKSELLAAQVEQMSQRYVAYKQALDKALSAMILGKREAALAALGQCLVINSEMVEHLHAMHDEARRMSTLKQEVQSVTQQMEENRIAFQRAMDEIIVANGEELYSQSNSAVVSVDRTKSLIWISLAIFVVLSLLLGAYTCFEYRRAKARLRAVQQAKESAYTEMHFLFNTIPMGCVMRNADFRLMNCNIAAAKMFGLEEQWTEMEDNAEAFGLKDKWEYLERYAELVHPEFQPDGELSIEKGARLFKQALEEGRVETKWMYQLPNGSPLPAEVILQRADWEGCLAVVYHIRDLRNTTEPCKQGERI